MQGWNLGIDLNKPKICIMEISWIADVNAGKIKRVICTNAPWIFHHLEVRPQALDFGIQDPNGRQLWSQMS